MYFCFVIDTHFGLLSPIYEISKSQHLEHAETHHFNENKNKYPLLQETKETKRCPKHIATFQSLEKVTEHLFNIGGDIRRFRQKHPVTFSRDWNVTIYLWQRLVSLVSCNNGCLCLFSLKWCPCVFQMLRFRNFVNRR